MRRINVLWAAAHDIQPEQRAELESVGDIIILKENNPNLWDRLTQMSPKDTRKVRDDLIDYVNKENIDLVVQLAGPPSFQFEMGEVSMDDAIEGGIFHKSPAFVWSYSRRESQDIPQKDGTSKKVSIFKHRGFFLASGLSLQHFMPKS